MKGREQDQQQEEDHQEQREEHDQPPGAAVPEATGLKEQDAESGSEVEEEKQLSERTRWESGKEGWPVKTEEEREEEEKNASSA